MLKFDSENLKSALVNKLLQLYPDVTIYKESISEPVYPNFFVYMIDFKDERKLNDYHKLTFNYEIRYRVASDGTTDLKLETTLDKMAFTLTQAFDLIEYGNEYIRCKEKSVQKTENNLHFLLSLETMAKSIDESKTYNKFASVKTTVKAK